MAAIASIELIRSLAISRLAVSVRFLSVRFDSVSIRFRFDFYISKGRFDLVSIIETSGRFDF